LLVVWTHSAEFFAPLERVEIKRHILSS
jgi:hypothetical protein